RGGSRWRGGGSRLRRGRNRLRGRCGYPSWSCDQIRCRVGEENRLIVTVIPGRVDDAVVIRCLTLGKPLEVTGQRPGRFDNDQTRSILCRFYSAEQQITGLHLCGTGHIDLIEAGPGDIAV